MAQTVEEIAVILGDMREENQRNNDNFEKVLTNINAKLELMSDDSEATDLLKLYISELKKSIEEKYNVSMERFKLLDKAFEQIVLDNVHLAKTTDLKELFDSFASSMGSFSVELASQKTFLDDVRQKVEKVQISVFDKNELALLLENLSSSVASMNLSYNATLSSIKEHVETLNSKEDLDLIKEKLESVLSLIDAVPEKVSFDSMNIELNELRDITKSIKDVVISNNEKFSIEVSEKFKKLENDFDKIVTEVDFAEFRTNLSDFVQKIIDNSAALNTQLSFGTEKLESIG